ncbi:hypothetical protein O181_087985 [Austropuccinia psidii MF-1]|uniref:Uncharacterized protein n=1 Tax=Austropuccinia psidii MF-1 TaxID=1389203 RepID=A0A9Q3P303_9BASI|nr:hypothetical protein [Austropuccinia psidii MF-1]
MVTSLSDRRKVIIQPMKDDNGKRIFELGSIVTMSCHPWDSNAKLVVLQPLHNHHLQYARWIPPSTPSPEFPPIAPKTPTGSSPHSQDGACQEFTDL